MLSEVEKINIHHMIIYECPSTYLGHPSQSSHNAFNDIVTSRICKSVSYRLGQNLILFNSKGYTNLMLLFFLFVRWGQGATTKLILPATTG